MSLKQGNFSFCARTAHNWLRMGKYGTYLEFCRSHEAPKHCQTLDSPTQSCARAHFRSPPGRPQFDCHCNEIWIHCLKEISDRNAVQSNWGQTGGNLKWALAQDWVGESEVWQCLGASSDLQNSRYVPYSPIRSQVWAVRARKEKLPCFKDIGPPTHFP